MTNGVHHETQGPRLKTPNRTVRQWVEAALQVALTGPFILAAMAMSRVGHRWIDLLAQFPVPLMIGTALATPLLLLAGFRRAAWQGLLATLVLFVAAAPQIMPPVARPDPGAETVRLYTANLHYRNDDTARMRRSIEAADPDIVVLIELGRGAVEDVDLLLKGYPHRVASVRLDQVRGPSRSVVASRYPLTAIADRPDGLHAVAAVARTPIGPVNVVGVHLTRPWPYQEQWGQISQTMALADIRRDLTGPVIVAGDFNSVSSGRIGRQVQTEMGLIPAPGFPGTWPADVPPIFGITIDQVYRSRDLAVTGRSLGLRTGSDHRPVIVDFTRAAD